MLYVKADVKETGSFEEFWFNEAGLLKNLGFDNFVNLLKQGKISIDISLGFHRDGKSHDHGSGFRKFPMDLDMYFENRKRII